MSLNTGILSPVLVASVVNQRSMQWLDDLAIKGHPVIAVLNSIVYQSIKEARQQKDFCEICMNGRACEKRERHHIAGRKHDYRTITACTVCHPWLTKRQTLWSREWLQPNLEVRQTIGFLLMGIHDILTLMAIRKGHSELHSLAIKFADNIAELTKPRRFRK
jgi:hypothetical protein